MNRQTNGVVPGALAVLVAAASDAMMTIDGAGIVASWNAGAESLFGYRGEEVVGRSITILDAPGEPSDAPEWLARVALGERIEEPHALRRRKDGLVLAVQVALMPVLDDAGRVACTAVVARRIDPGDAREQAERTQAREAALRDALTALRRSHEDLKAAQLQLIQSAKLESVGRLAASVAHEVKNPLAIILAGIEYVGRNVDAADANLAGAVQDIRGAVARANAVIGGLLNYAAATELTPTVEDFNEVVDQALLLVKHAVHGRTVHFERELEPGLPRLLLDKPKIEQVLVNLFINAIDAMPEGGVLRVRTQRRQLRGTGHDVGYRQTDPFRVGQTVVVVEVEDTGTGISAGDLTRVFDPFFTTKPPGKGTGLGLAVSKTIVALHGGTLTLENREGGGARAIIVLKSVSA